MIGSGLLGDLDLPPAPEVGAAVLEAHGVGLQIDGARILDDVSITAYGGEVLALVGPNGAGKSSLLSIMSGDRAATAGTVTLAGRPLGRWNHLELALRRAVMLQQTTVAFSYTVRDVVRMGRSPWSRTAVDADDAAVVGAAMAAGDVVGLADRTVTSLSGGELARVSFARVVAQSTAVVLLDEPTASLDLRHQELVMREIGSRTRAGAAAVVVMHDLNLAAAHADRVAVLARGRLVAVGPPTAVLTAELLSDVYEHPVDVLPHPATGAPLILPRR